MIALTIITAAYHFGGRCAMIGEREEQLSLTGKNNCRQSSMPVFCYSCIPAVCYLWDTYPGGS